MADKVLVHVEITPEETEVLRRFVNSPKGPVAIKMLFEAAIQGGGLGLFQAMADIANTHFKDDPKSFKILSKIVLGLES